MGRVECALLGSLSIMVDGRQVGLGGPKQRLLLALLLSRANSVVAVNELIDALWEEHPPRTARKNIQVYVSGLRKIFGERLSYSGYGYRLSVDHDECDVLRFAHLSTKARRALREGESHAAVELLWRAVELWREPPLAEFAGQAWLAGEIGRLTERFLTTLEDWAELELERGGYRRVLDRLDGPARRHPLRQRLAAAWMRALAAGGRVAEALDHYDAIRRALARELGIDPGRALTDLHERLIRGEEDTAPAISASGRTVFHHIGRDLPDFVGRTEQIRRVVDTIVDDRGSDVVVVCGPVGVGKTAFAVHVAHLLRESFRDGLIMVELTTADGVPRTCDAVLAELMDLAGLSVEPVKGLPGALARWRAWLATRRLLLILDGATQEHVVRALLPAAGGSRAIVTARYRLSGLESVLRLELGAPTELERMELFGRIVGWDRVLAERGAAHEILAHCEGLPLAVRIVGAKLSALRHVRLRDYLARLRDNRSFMDEMVAGELDIRSRYEAFYRGLTDQQRATYLRLAALPGPPFDHGSVMSTLDDLGRSAESALESLVECTLLTVPDCAISARCAAYGMSVFAYQFGGDRAAPRRAA